MLKLKQKQMHITNTGPPPQSQPNSKSYGPNVVLSTCDFASVNYMQIWLKEFSFSVSSISLSAPYFLVIWRCDFWTHRIVHLNCLSTDHVVAFLAQMQVLQHTHHG